MSGDMTSIRREILARRREEIETLKVLNDPHIVRILGYSESAVYRTKKAHSLPVMYIAMELMPHGDLYDVLYYTKGLQEPLARVYFRQIIEAVNVCHERGISHRDLKSENILVDADFRLKLADFGFAAPVEGRDGSGLLHTRLESESYMAPEILEHERYSGPAVDIFACGVILFTLITSAPPFVKATADDLYTLFKRDNQRFWAHHSTLRPIISFSDDFKDLVNSMLAQDPDNRPTAAQVLQHPWLNGPTLDWDQARTRIAEKWSAAQVKKAKEKAQEASHKTGRRAVPGPAGYKDLPEDEEIRLPAYVEGTAKFSRLFVDFKPHAAIQLLERIFRDKGGEVTASETKAKVKARIEHEGEHIAVRAKLFDAGERGICVDVTKVAGSTFGFMLVFEELRREIEELEEEL